MKIKSCYMKLNVAFMFINDELQVIRNQLHVIGCNSGSKIGGLLRSFLSRNNVIMSPEEIGINSAKQSPNQY